MKILTTVATIGLFFTATSALCQTTITPEKELFITDLSVVNSSEATDEDGAFHIKTLFGNMAPTGKDAKDVMLSFLNSWANNTNPDLPAKSAMENIIVSWKRVGIPLSQPTPSDDDWVVNWSEAPFRLLAIVNRLDLRHNPGNGNAGEGRFVFCMVDRASSLPLQFNVIFEYLQPASTEEEIKEVAEHWHELAAFTNFNQGYLDKLVEITETFSAKNALPGGPNGNAIAQIRTNEIALGGTWELREFKLVDGAFLRPARVALTPRNDLDNTSVLGFMLNTLGSDAGTFPQQLIDVRALTPFNFEWRAKDIQGAAIPRDNATLRKFSVNTCNGCHGKDGAAFDGILFVHVEPRQVNQPSRLSRFLTGNHPSGGTPSVVIDPATGNEVQSFSDLANRATDMAHLLDSDTDSLLSLFQESKGFTAGQASKLEQLMRFRAGMRIRKH